MPVRYGPRVRVCEGGVRHKMGWQMACGEGRRCAGLTPGLGQGDGRMYIKVGPGVALPSAGIGSYVSCLEISDLLCCCRSTTHLIGLA